MSCSTSFTVVTLALSCYDLWYIRSQQRCYLEWTLSQRMCIIMWSSTSNNVLMMKTSCKPVHLVSQHITACYQCFSVTHVSRTGPVLFEFGWSNNYITMQAYTTIYRSLTRLRYSLMNNLKHYRVYQAWWSSQDTSIWVYLGTSCAAAHSCCAQHHKIHKPWTHCINFIKMVSLIL